MAAANNNRRPIRHDDQQATPKQNKGHDVFSNGDDTHGKLSKGTPLNTILDICRRPPQVKDMEQIKDQKSIFMISPFKYDSSHPNRESKAINDGKVYIDRWDENHVRMPCSPNYTSRNKQPIWPMISQTLMDLKQKCDSKTATIEHLKTTIENCAGRSYDIGCLEILINEVYSRNERTHFMSTVLSTICLLALNVDTICSRPPPLLRIGSDQSVTMSQRQAASLLACGFFCLFPYRFDHEQIKEYENFQNPNFNRLYQIGPLEKIEKLKCILHYFRRVAEKNKKIEDINGVLQVDFANKYIGGGVLESGCVQEEIRFSICPEMLVSLLVCEMMESNECVFLVGCERCSLYEGYSDSFKFAGNYDDHTPKDNWGRKWCHLVAMDAILFRDPSAQYDMKCTDRELIKAYASFHLRPTQTGAETLFGIATGSWGCGVFNGDKQLKAIIQLMAASKAGRPLIYAAYRDKNFVTSFAEVYEFLRNQKATVGNLYQHLERYSTQYTRGLLFDYILNTPIRSQKF